jgi:hypothetical protein
MKCVILHNMFWSNHALSCQRNFLTFKLSFITTLYISYVLDMSFNGAIGRNQIGVGNGWHFSTWASSLVLVRFRGIQSGQDNKCMKNIMIWTRIYSRSKINLPIMIGRTRDHRAGLVSHSWLVEWFRAFWCTYHEQINFRPGINPDLL